MTNQEFVIEILKLMSNYDSTDSLFWKWQKDKNEFKVYVVCNDLFCWASADLEEITQENLTELKKAYEDAVAASPTFGEIYGSDLFCARIRGERPQGAAYPREKELYPLFNAVGPERKIGFGNPHKPGESK
jgi:hypothetical protein